MTQSIRLFVMGALCAAIAGCTSTTSEMSSPALALAPTATPAVMSTASMGGAPRTGEVAQDLYYIEFRARTAESYGHTFAMFGRRDAAGNILTREVAGLHPASTSVVPYLAGHLVPVPSETGPSDGDLEDQYMIANYRIDLTRAEYENVLGYIRSLQASRPVWHAALYNCNSFVGDIAKHMGLRAPANHLLFPERYINTLKDMNGDRRTIAGL